ncbi:MAG: hypothetical protein WCX95_04865 [Candidatus Gracilibacteria bacterium]
MFKENRFIFEHAEFLPSGKRRKLFFGERKEYDGGEMPKEVQEKEKKEKEDNVRVAEKLMNNLEMTGIKCPRCGLKNVSEIGIIPPNKKMLYCLDCRYKWEVE